MTIATCCDVELRARIEEETETALQLADELALAIASRSPLLAETAANYLQTRALIRRLRRTLTVVVAG